ncbi:MAG: hypothetical protein ACK5JR_16920 [Tropicimonas sp.]|uniref:hypothetical protein n=1 Tax=Tropicimonas sp. TaxID=2067044 RepID=UPI003A8A88E2
MNRLLATTSLALLAAATPGWAEITPAEVWDHLVRQYQSMGYTVTEGSREEAGDTLTITDARIAVDGEFSSMIMTMPKVAMNQTGDGNVRWSIDGDIAGEITTHGLEDNDQVITYTVGMPGNETVSSGTADDLTHEFKAEQMLFAMDMPMEGSGAVMPMAVTLEGVAGTQHSVRGDAGVETTVESSAGKLVMTAKGDMPETADGGPGTMSLEATVDGLAMSGRMLVAPGDFNMETQMTEALQAGTQLAFDLTYAASNGTFSFSGPGEDGTLQTGDGSYTSGPGTGRFGLSQDGLKYASSAETIDASMTLGNLPFPMSYQVAKGGFDLEMPVLASDQPAPFKLLTSITGLGINDELWSLFDPQGKLAHDPADLNIDVAGDVLLSESLLTPPTDMDMPMGDQADTDMADDGTGTDAPGMAAMPQPPVPVRVTLNDLTLRAVGAEARVSGELTAPEGGDMMAAPVGQIEGQFAGVNALLDTLGAMGLVPDDQMMGARMMLAMFAKPVEGETDKLQTRLEFGADGSIFANGQKVK